MDALRKKSDLIASILWFNHGFNSMTIFWSICVHTMFSKQNETEPMELDCPQKRHGKFEVFIRCIPHITYTHTHSHKQTNKQTNVKADELIALGAEQYRWQQTTNDQWGKGMQTVSYQAKRFIIKLLLVTDRKKYIRTKPGVCMCMCACRVFCKCVIHWMCRIGPLK